jgi:ribonuclease-3
MSEALESVQKILSHRFGEVKLLTEALTHSSFANEQEALDRDNERLEFLGDAVLELTVSEALFARFPEAPEGELTRMRARLVSEPTLAGLARDLGLSEALRLGKGEQMQGGRDRDSLLSDALEAILGAVFLDGGFEAARSLVERLYADHWPSRPAAPKAKDHKSRLQEMTQRTHKARPVYTLAESFGPEHAKVFDVALSLPDGRVVRAQGPSMKKAEQTAAAKALELLSREGT